MNFITVYACARHVLDVYDMYLPIFWNYFKDGHVLPRRVRHVYTIYLALAVLDTYPKQVALRTCWCDIWWQTYMHV